jgi:hypothetical protein
MMAHQEKPDEHKLEEMILFFSNMCDSISSFSTPTFVLTKCLVNPYLD